MSETAQQLPLDFDLSQLTARDRLYLLEYIKDFNAARSALAVGYSESTAYKQAASWIGKTRESSAKPHLYDALQHILDVRARSCWVDAQAVLDELSLIGFADIGDFVWVDAEGNVRVKGFDEIDPKKRRALMSVKQTPRKFGKAVELKLHDKIAALVKCGQHVGLFADRLEVTGAAGGPVELKWAE